MILVRRRSELKFAPIRRKKRGTVPIISERVYPDFVGTGQRYMSIFVTKLGWILAICSSKQNPEQALSLNLDDAHYKQLHFSKNGWKCSCLVLRQISMFFLFKKCLWHDLNLIAKKDSVQKQAIGSLPVTAISGIIGKRDDFTSAFLIY